MTISVRNPAVRPSASRRATPPARSIAATALSTALGTLRAAVRREPAAPADFRYALTRFDVVFDRATESSDEVRAEQRTDRRAALLCLTVGVAVVVVVAVAAAVLLHEIMHLASTALG